MLVVGACKCMHELPITQSILDIALKHATQASPDLTRITAVHLVIGQYASVVDDSVQFYWDIIAKDTPAEGAVLHFRRVPGRMVCLDCAREFSPKPDDFICPQCGSAHVKVTCGEEFFLEAIDIES